MIGNIRFTEIKTGWRYEHGKGEKLRLYFSKDKDGKEVDASTVTDKNKKNYTEKKEAVEEKKAEFDQDYRDASAAHSPQQGSSHMRSVDDCSLEIKQAFCPHPDGIAQAYTQFIYLGVTGSFYLDNDRTKRHAIPQPFFLKRRNLAQFCFNLYLLAEQPVEPLIEAMVDAYAAELGWSTSRRSAETETIKRQVNRRWSLHKTGELRRKHEQQNKL